MMIWTDKTILVKHDPNIENRIGGTVRVRRAHIQCGTCRSWVRARLGQTKDYEIGICCFSTKHAVLRSKNKDSEEVGSEAG
jgi:hypothetical protein